MRAEILQRQLRAFVSSRLPVVKYEARTLFNRRKVSYAVLATTLAGAVLYVGTMSRPVVTQTEAGTTGATQSEDGGSMHDQTQAKNNNDDQSSKTSQSGGHASADSSTQSWTSVTVNGQSFSVPVNGALHTVIPNGDSQTSVDISHSSSSNSSSSVQVDVSTTSDGGAQGS